LPVAADVAADRFAYRDFHLLLRQAETGFKTDLIGLDRKAGDVIVAVGRQQIQLPRREPVRIGLRNGARGRHQHVGKLHATSPETGHQRTRST
jgi:hypothetical protein